MTVFLILAAVVVGVPLAVAYLRPKKNNKQTIMINGQEYEFDPNKVSIDLDDMERKLSEAQENNREWERQFNELFAHVNAGKAAEKDGDTQAAIRSYEEAVRYGREAPRMKVNNYFHSIERLAILYRRIKDYDSEVSLLSSTLDEALSERDRADIEYRLNKAKTLQNKNRQ